MITSSKGFPHYGIRLLVDKFPHFLHDPIAHGKFGAVPYEALRSSNNTHKTCLIHPLMALFCILKTIKTVFIAN